MQSQNLKCSQQKSSSFIFNFWFLCSLPVRVSVRCRSGFQHHCWSVCFITSHFTLEYGVYHPGASFITSISASFIKYLHGELHSSSLTTNMAWESTNQDGNYLNTTGTAMLFQKVSIRPLWLFPLPTPCESKALVCLAHHCVPFEPQTVSDRVPAQK